MTEERSHAAQDLHARLLRFRSGSEAVHAPHLAQDLLQAGRLDEALEVCADPRTQQEDAYLPLLVEGRVALQRGELLKAQALFVRAVQLEPQKSEAFAALGELLLQRGDPRRAETALSKASSLNPADPALAALRDKARRLAGLAVPSADFDPKQEPNLASKATSVAAPARSQEPRSQEPRSQGPRSHTPPPHTAAPRSHAAPSLAPPSDGQLPSARFRASIHALRKAIAEVGPSASTAPKPHPPPAAVPPPSPGPLSRAPLAPLAPSITSVAKPGTPIAEAWDDDEAPTSRLSAADAARFSLGRARIAPAKRGNSDLRKGEVSAKEGDSETHADPHASSARAQTHDVASATLLSPSMRPAASPETLAAPHTVEPTKPAETTEPISLHDSVDKHPSATIFDARASGRAIDDGSEPPTRSHSSEPPTRNRILSLSPSATRADAGLGEDKARTHPPKAPPAPPRHLRDRARGPADPGRDAPPSGGTPAGRSVDKNDIAHEDTLEAPPRSSVLAKTSHASHEEAHGEPHHETERPSRPSSRNLMSDPLELRGPVEGAATPPEASNRAFESRARNSPLDADEGPTQASVRRIKTIAPDDALQAPFAGTAGHAPQSIEDPALRPISIGELQTELIEPQAWQVPSRAPGGLDASVQNAPGAASEAGAQPVQGLQRTPMQRAASRAPTIQAIPTAQEERAREAHNEKRQERRRRVKRRLTALLLVGLLGLGGWWWMNQQKDVFRRIDQRAQSLALLGDMPRLQEASVLLHSSPNYVAGAKKQQRLLALSLQEALDEGVDAREPIQQALRDKTLAASTPGKLAASWLTLTRQPGREGLEAVERTLLDAVLHKNAHIRYLAARLLLTIGHPRGLDALDRLLREKPGAHAVRAALVEAMAMEGHWEGADKVLYGASPDSQAGDSQARDFQGPLPSKRLARWAALLRADEATRQALALDDNAMDDNAMDDNAMESRADEPLPRDADAGEDAAAGKASPEGTSTGSASVNAEAAARIKASVSPMDAWMTLLVHTKEVIAQADSPQAGSEEAARRVGETAQEGKANSPGTKAAPAGNGSDSASSTAKDVPASKDAVTKDAVANAAGDESPRDASQEEATQADNNDPPDESDLAGKSNAPDKSAADKGAAGETPSTDALSAENDRSIIVVQTPKVPWETMRKLGQKQPHDLGRMLRLSASFFQHVDLVAHAHHAAELALDAAPFHARARLILAECFLTRRNGKRALEVLGPLTLDHRDVLRLGGLVALEIGEKRALSNAFESLRKQPKSDALVARQNLILLHWIDARLHPKDNEDAREQLMRAIDQDPHPALLRLLMRAFVDIEHNRGVQDILARMAAMPRKEASDWTAMAQGHLALGQVEKAEQSLRSALRERPWHHDAERLLAKLSRQRGAYEQAEPLLRHLVSDDRWDPDSRELLSLRLEYIEALLEQDKIAEAKTALGDIPTSDRVSLEVRPLEARILLGEGEVQRALDMIQTLARSSNPPAHVLLLYGQIIAELEGTQQAIKHYVAATKADKENMEAVFALAEAYLDTNMGGRAMALAERAEKMLDVLPSTSKQRAKARYLLGRAMAVRRKVFRKRAIKALREATQMEGAPAEAWFFLGQTLEGGNASEQAFRTYLDKQPTGERANEAREALGLPALDEDAQNADEPASSDAEPKPVEQSPKQNVEQSSKNESASP